MTMSKGLQFLYWEKSIEIGICYKKEHDNSDEEGDFVKELAHTFKGGFKVVNKLYYVIR